MRKVVLISGIAYFFLGLIWLLQTPGLLSLYQGFKASAPPHPYLIPLTILSFGVLQITICLRKNSSKRLMQLLLAVAIALPIIFFLIAFFLPLIILRNQT